MTRDEYLIKEETANAAFGSAVQIIAEEFISSGMDGSEIAGLMLSIIERIEGEREEMIGEEEGEEEETPPAPLVRGERAESPLVRGEEEEEKEEKNPPSPPCQGGEEGSPLVGGEEGERVVVLTPGDGVTTDEDGELFLGRDLPFACEMDRDAGVRICAALKFSTSVVRKRLARKLGIADSTFSLSNRYRRALVILIKNGIVGEKKAGGHSVLFLKK